MNWSSPMDIQYPNTNGMPYNSIGSFVDFFGGLAYDHVNFIFADAPSYAQESVYPSMSTNYHKYGITEPGSFSYYNYNYGYVASDHTPPVDEYASAPLQNPPSLANDQQAGNSSSTSDISSPMDGPRHHQGSRTEAVWQDNVDPDNMTYEELLELGEAVGSQSRGLSEDVISMLPVSKHRCSLFSRKRSRRERCVICQMEYKRGEMRMTLPCKHKYHAGCCRRWLGINKACPICYTEVRIGAGGASNN